jgi:hypothetical protein
MTQLVCLKYVDQVWILLLGWSLFKKIKKKNTGCNCKNENGSIEDLLNNNEPSKKIKYRKQ